MKIYTKAGDDGTTGLFGSTRVPKNNVRIVALGNVDEANAWLGSAQAALAGTPAEPLVAVLRRVQHRLFTLGSMVATPPESAAYATIPKLTEADVVFLEKAIDRLDSDLTPLTRFILPGGSEGAARLHVARSVVRRAERSLVAAGRLPAGQVNPFARRYLNRLSDFLFTAARWANARAGIADTPWER